MATLGKACVTYEPGFLQRLVLLYTASVSEAVYWNICPLHARVIINKLSLKEHAGKSYMDSHALFVKRGSIGVSDWRMITVKLVLQFYRN